MNVPIEIAIRDAFLAAGKGLLRVSNMALHPESTGTRLTFTGWHADGSPFAEHTAPTTGSLVERSAQLARDIINTHHGEAPMPTEQAFDLSSVLRDFKSVSDRVTAVAAKAKAGVENIHQVLNDAEGQIAKVNNAAADIQAALGLSTNGGPKLDP